MTTKTITGTYANGYVLAVGFLGLSITNFGLVESAPGVAGSNGSAGAPNGGAGGNAGAVALSLPKGGSLANAGVVRAGTGGVGGGGYGKGLEGAGGIGGVGIAAASYVSFSNLGRISGGAGGAGAPAGNGWNPGGAGGSGGAGITVTGGGSISNLGSVSGGHGGDGGAAIYGVGTYAFGGPGGSGGYGIVFSGLGSVTNKGTISGGDGGNSVKGYSHFYGRGGNGGDGVVLEGGVVVNLGLIEGGGGGGSIYNPGAGGGGVGVGESGSVINYGTINGGGGALGAGGGVYAGYVKNGDASNRAALINGGTGVSMREGTIANFGTIEGLGHLEGLGLSGGTAIYSLYAANITNGSGSDTTALIYGTQHGVVMDGGTITNHGTIVGGVSLKFAVGSSFSAPGTVINYGTIDLGFAFDAGPYPVLLASSRDRLIAEAGSVFVGTIVGGGGALELAGGAGTITGLGATGTISGGIAASFKGFGDYRIDTGASWLLSGENSLGAGQSLEIEGTVTNAGAFGGTGVVLGAGTLANQASAVIDADTGGLVLETSGGITNGGLIEATGGLLLIEDTTVNNAGGTILAAGRRVDLANVDIIGGALQTTGTGAIAVTSGASALDGTAGHSVTLSGNLIVQDNTSLTIQGSIINTGRISLAGGADITDLIVGAGGATLAGGGEVLLSRSDLNRINTTGAGHVTLTNVDNRILGAGDISNATLTLVNEAAGVITAPDGIGLVISTGANAVVNAGLIEATGTGGLTIKSAVANSGLLYAAKGNLTVVGAVSGAGTARVAGATLDFASSFSQNVTFTGSAGVLKLARSQAYGGTIHNFSNTGSTQLDLGDIGFISASEATFSGGVLTVTDGKHTAHIHLAGNYSGSTFVASSDGHGGTIVTDPAATGQAAARFASAIAGFGAASAGRANLEADLRRMDPPMLTTPRSAMA
jgi:hypothetical protein